MSGLFASGRIVDLILIFTVLEAAGLIVWRRRTGRGLPPGDLISTLSSGVCLMLALRCALVGGWWGWTGACLAAALLAHVTDLGRRWGKSKLQE